MRFSIIKKVTVELASILTKVLGKIEHGYLKKFSVSGNRTPVSRELWAMTGGDNHHYTNTDMLSISFSFIETSRR